MKKTANIQTAEGRKELAAKTAAAIAERKAQADAMQDIAAESKAAKGKAKPAEPVKVPEVKPEEKKPAEVKAPKEKKEAAPTETKEQKENKRQAEFAAIAADLLKKTKINAGVARTDKAQVKAGDIIAFHQNGEFLQVFKIAYMTPDKSIMLQLQREDSLHNPPDSVGAWTFEDWRVNGLRNVFASKATSREKFLRIAIFAGV